MARRLIVPVLTEESARVDAVRRRLGGRATSEPGVGEIVRMRAEGGTGRLGVVLFTHGDELHLMTDEVTVRRTSRANVSPPASSPPEPLLAVAADAQVFAALHEGQRVRYLDGTELREARLVEKCRYGGILLRDDQGLLGVGFRKIWPAASGDAEVS